jgi:hypothetical protein
MRYYCEILTERLIADSQNQAPYPPVVVKLTNQLKTVSDELFSVMKDRSDAPLCTPGRVIENSTLRR